MEVCPVTMTDRERQPLQSSQECGRIRRLIHCPDTGSSICPESHPRVAIEDGEARILESPGPDAGTVDVRPRAYFDGDEVSEVQIESLEYDPGTNTVRSQFREIPAAEPGEFAEEHFTRRPGAELVDGFAQCLPKWERPRDYPLDPGR